MIINFQPKRFFISTFEVNRVGAQTSDKVEFHLTSEARGQMPFEVLKRTIWTTLSNLEQRLSDAN